MSKDIIVYTASTMNGWKPIFLEEAGVDYELYHIDFSKKEQKEDWFLQINPNGRIPAIVDRSNEDFKVFESAAILSYLSDKYQKFNYKDPKLRNEVLQWMCFQVSAVGPMMGQAMYFQRIAAKNGVHDQFAIDRYVDESRRLLEVLNTKLSSSKFIVGDQYTIADMCLYPWIKKVTFGQMCL